MHPETLSRDLLRLITNQKREHCAHPFRSSGVGLQDFASLFRLLPSCSESELVEVLRQIDSMAIGHVDCFSCSAKILAFCELFAGERLPSHRLDYTYAFDKLTLAQRDLDRDYREEVAAILELPHPMREQRKFCDVRGPTLDIWFVAGSEPQTDWINPMPNVVFSVSPVVGSGDLLRIRVESGLGLQREIVTIHAFLHRYAREISGLDGVESASVSLTKQVLLGTLREHDGLFGSVELESFSLEPKFLELCGKLGIGVNISLTYPDHEDFT